MVKLLVLFGVGIVLGILIANVVGLVRTTFGTLVIDCSNPEKDSYIINVDNLDNLNKKKQVILKVVDMSSISQN